MKRETPVGICGGCGIKLQAEGHTRCDKCVEIMLAIETSNFLESDNNRAWMQAEINQAELDAEASEGGDAGIVPCLPDDPHGPGYPYHND